MNYGPTLLMIGASAVLPTWAHATCAPEHLPACVKPRATVHPSSTVAAGAQVGNWANIGPDIAVGAAFIAPGASLAGRILLAMVLARSAAMAFNRLVDHRFDATNPRTRGRALPSGRVSRPAMTGFLVVCSAAFIAVAVVVFGSIAWFSGGLGERFRSSPRAQAILNRVAGVVFVGLAARLAVAER